MSADPAVSPPQNSSCDLVNRRCVPCEGGVPKLTLDESNALLATLPGWSLLENPARIQKHWSFRNFRTALQFLNQVGEVAEAEQHHPDLHLISYRQVQIDIWTHAINGLSENDFILAAKIDALPG